MVIRTRTSGSTTITDSATLLPRPPDRLDMPYQCLADASVPGAGVGTDARRMRQTAYAAIGSARTTHAERIDSSCRAKPPACGADRKSTRLNSSHGYISYAVFCLKK